jgi:hypothetical protein
VSVTRKHFLSCRCRDCLVTLQHRAEDAAREAADDAQIARLLILGGVAGVASIGLLLALLSWTGWLEFL